MAIFFKLEDSVCQGRDEWLVGTTGARYPKGIKEVGKKLDQIVVKSSVDSSG